MSSLRAWLQQCRGWRKRHSSVYDVERARHAHGDLTCHVSAFFFEHKTGIVMYSGDGVSQTVLHRCERTPFPAAGTGPLHLFFNLHGAWSLGWAGLIQPCSMSSESGYIKSSTSVPLDCGVTRQVDLCSRWWRGFFRLGGNRGIFFKVPTRCLDSRSRSQEGLRGGAYTPFWLKPFHARNSICDLFAACEVVLWSLGVCCAFSIPAIVLWRCCLYFIGSRRVFGMVSDGFQVQKRCSWIPCKERAERVLANAISMDGKRSGRANCVQNRMCGLGGVAGDVTTTSWRGCTGSFGRRSLQSRESGLQARRRGVRRTRSSEQGLMPRKRKEGSQKGAGIPFKEEGLGRSVEIAWKPRMRPSVAENWMNREGSCSRSYEWSTDCPSCQRKCMRASRSRCSTSCKRWRKGGTISCLSTRRCKRGRRRYKASRKEGEICRERESLASKEEMRKLREYIDWKEERFRLLSDKVDKNRMADAKMEAELQGLQAGEERRGSTASQAVDCCLETVVEQIFAMGTDQARSTFDAFSQIFFKRFETFAPLRANARKRRRKKRQ